MDVWIWNLQQDNRLNEIESNVRRVNQSAKQRIDVLEREITRLSLSCNAMWSLLSEKLNLTDADLSARIADLDSHQGRLQGALAAQRPCTSCGRSVRADRRWCLYCGVEGAAVSGQTA